jgi:hypothetical protein
MRGLQTGPDFEQDPIVPKSRVLIVLLGTMLVAGLGFAGIEDGPDATGHFAKSITSYEPQPRIDFTSVFVGGTPDTGLIFMHPTLNMTCCESGCRLQDTSEHGGCVLASVEETWDIYGRHCRCIFICMPVLKYLW